MHPATEAVVYVWHAAARDVRVERHATRVSDPESSVSHRRQSAPCRKPSGSFTLLADIRAFRRTLHSPPKSSSCPWARALAGGDSARGAGMALGPRPRACWQAGATVAFKSAGLSMTTVTATLARAPRHDARPATGWPLQSRWHGPADSDGPASSKQHRADKGALPLEFPRNPTADFSAKPGPQGPLSTA